MPSGFDAREVGRLAVPVVLVVVTVGVAALVGVTLFGGGGDDQVVVRTDAVVEVPEDDVAADRADTADPGAETDGDAVGADDGSVDGGDGDGGDATGGDGAGDGGAADAGGDGGEAEEVDTTISENPLTIGLMVADADELTPQEISLRRMLAGNGHRVRPFTVTAEPIVNAVNNPGIDLLLFSPSFEFSLLYYPSDPNSLPMLDMARYSWYRRYMLPWGDDVIGPRFSGRGETTIMGWYEDDSVIDWEGQEEGPVQLLTGERFSGEAPMKEAMDHSTNGAAQYFLRHVTDQEGESTLGVYVPPGSTITMPAPTLAEEQRFTSVAPWIGLLLFTDDPEVDYTEMTPAGEALFEAAFELLMNP